ncbi:MAG: hypothetical protein ABI210_13345, partial [Abditibacteriaceae bacterium]
IADDSRVYSIDLFCFSSWPPTKNIISKVLFVETPRRGNAMLAQANGLGQFHHRIFSPEGAARNETWLFATFNNLL